MASENLRRGDQTWKVRMIRGKFGRLIFDVQDVSHSTSDLHSSAKE